MGKNLAISCMVCSMSLKNLETEVKWKTEEEAVGIKKIYLQRMNSLSKSSR